MLNPIPAPYMHWAKTRPPARYDLALSNVPACTIADLEGAREALSLEGRNDNGYAPLADAIARRYGVPPDHVTTAQGTSGANFLVYATLVEPGDEVLVERPGYDPLEGAARRLGARTVPYERPFEDGHRLDPERIARAMTPRTRLIVVTSPHNPSGVIADHDALREIGRLAASRGAYVLVDEVYMDAAASPLPSAATLGEPYIATSSLTKSYGLAGLRSGWILSSPAVAERLRRARDIVDGTGSIVTERLSALAFAQVDALLARARVLLARNRPIIAAFLEGRAELDWVPPAQATVVFPRVRGLADTSGFADTLLQTWDTAVVPGRFFGAPAHVRVGFSIATAVLEAGLARLGEALDARP